MYYNFMFIYFTFLLFYYYYYFLLRDNSIDNIKCVSKGGTTGMDVLTFPQNLRTRVFYGGRK